jgi:hypothetical protein
MRVYNKSTRLHDQDDVLYGAGLVRACVRACRMGYKYSVGHREKYRHMTGVPAACRE